MNIRSTSANNDIDVYKPTSFMEKNIIPTREIFTNPNNKDAFL